jgi:SAM-dependent methyltransferase
MIPDHVRALLRCPVSGDSLEPLEPWLFHSVSPDLLYPLLCETLILQPRFDLLVQRFGQALLQTMATFGCDEEAKEWFLARFGLFHPDPSPKPDLAFVGEGYPGVLDMIVDADSELAHLSPFLLNTSEDLIAETIGSHRAALGLDLGCGCGGMTYRMAHTCDTVLGLERHCFTAALANWLLKNEEIPVSLIDPEQGPRNYHYRKEIMENAHVLCADAHALPFSEPLFDWVHLGRLIDVEDEPEDILASVCRILKPGGTLSMISPQDLPHLGHLDRFLENLDADFTTLHESRNSFWLKPEHSRKWTLSQEWTWVGKLRK